jgi:hypothetical protein
LNTTYINADILENISNNQIFLNHEKISELNLELEDVQEQLVNKILTYDHIDKAYSATTLNSVSFNNGIEALLQKGYNQKRSGDVIYIMEPGFISYSKRDAILKSYDPKKGTTHGSGFNYDTHVPLIFFGKGIKHGQTLEKTEITDIAPTISALLGISFPNGTIGQPLEFLLD